MVRGAPAFAWQAAASGIRFRREADLLWNWGSWELERVLAQLHFIAEIFVFFFDDPAFEIDGRSLAQYAIHQRDDEERGERRQEQAADDGAAQRRVLFTAFTQAERHGEHADDHRAGGHDD